MKKLIYIFLLCPILSIAQIQDELVIRKLDTIPIIELKHTIVHNNSIDDLTTREDIISSFKKEEDSIFITSDNHMYIGKDSTYKLINFNLSKIDVELMGLNNCKINTPNNYFLDSLGTNGLFLKVIWTGFRSSFEKKANGLTIIDMQNLNIVFQGIVSYDNWKFKRVQLWEGDADNFSYLKFQSNDLIPEENYFYFYKYYHTNREIYELKNRIFVRMEEKTNATKNKQH